MKRRAARVMMSFTLLFAAFSLAQASAQESSGEISIRDAVARDFVKLVLEKAGSPNSIALNFENKSSLSPADATVFRKSLEKYFRAAKTSIVRPERAEDEVTITITEDMRGDLLVAQIKLGTETAVVMQEVRRADIGTVAPSLGNKVELNDKTLWADSVQILDFATPDNKTIVLLKPESIVALRLDGSEPARSANIARDRPWPRDLRGRLTMNGNAIEAHLPGVVCKGQLGKTFEIRCQDSEDPWPLITGSQTMSAFFSPTRNFFTGAVVVSDVAAEQDLPAFYSGANLGEGASSLWLFASANGKAQLYSKLTQPVKTYLGWGSSLAGIKSDCSGGSWMVLTTHPGDATEGDQLRLVQIVNRDAQPVSAPLEVHGTVVEMWNVADNSSANVIVRDLETGAYVAHRITAVCAR
jgi:hypothetical protein